ncbi:MAG: AAA family ATPase [Thermoplasmata archaeon]|nr:AAA family ATPase [Thermoplasmata archaeon]
MKPIIIGSVNGNAGKTSLIIGIGKVLEGEFQYAKPLGDRHVYKKKRLWDHDVGLMENIFGLDTDSSKTTIGYDHSKLRYMYDEEQINEKLKELTRPLKEGMVILEGGRNLTFGSSVNLDVINMARTLEANLILLISGDSDYIMDQLRYIKKHVRLDDVDLQGVIINKVSDVDEFKAEFLPDIEAMGIKILGIIPFERSLAEFTVANIADKLFARVIAGEDGLLRKVKNIFVGAASVNSALMNPKFSKVEKLIITDGDRSDIILAALGNHTSGIVLTNNILPPANIISKADEKKVPMMLVPFDTYETAKKIDRMVPLLTKDDKERIELVSYLVRENVDLKSIISS